MKGKRLVIIAALLLLLSLILGLFCIFSFGFFGSVDYSVDEALFRSGSEARGTVYYAFDDSGSPVEIYKSQDARQREWRELEDVSEYLKLAFISAEDREFFSHNGVNYKRSIGAMLNHIFKFKSSFGGSTITQQVIKNISGDNEHTVKRKLQEIFRALHLEANHTKEEILELYLNIVPMSNNIYGVAAAAKSFFGKEASELTLAEAATLAGITNSPARYNPYNHREECKEKRNRVLYAMLDNGVISREEYEKARIEELEVKERGGRENEISSWFIETVRADAIRDLVKKYSVSEGAASLMLNSGTSVYTTMRPSVQAELEAVFENQEHFPKEIELGLDMAMAVCDSKNGDLVGIIGSVGKKEGELLLSLATEAHTPGSVLKPLALYAPLLDRGRINWATVFDDLPLSVAEEDGELRLYPHNSPDVYSGLITVKEALMLSKNTVACRLYEMLGSEEIYRILTEDYGIDSVVREAEDKEGKKITDMAMSPMALGQLSYGISVRKLTECFTAFAREGIATNARSYYRIIGSDGSLLIENTKNDRRIMKKTSAEIINKLLMTVTEEGTAKRITLKNEVDTAGKTGTSGGGFDKLFVGYTPYYTAGIWCGYRDGGRPVPYSALHLDVWDKVMRSVHESELSNGAEKRSFSTEGLVISPYCKDSGSLPGRLCELDERGGRIEYGYFTPDNMPEGECHTHTLSFTDGGVKVRLKLKRDIDPRIEVGDGEYILKTGEYRAPEPEEVEQEKKRRFHIFPW